MPRFTNMLAEGMKGRGHTIEIWYPEPKATKMAFHLKLKKWFGYIDQFLIFPKEVREKLRFIPDNTLFVFSDQALGPWVPLVKDRPHVIHCHDFLAQLSAFDKIDEHRTSWSGKKYQKMIRDGFRKGQNFISVSNKTKDDLHDFLLSEPKRSEVIYNGLNQNFTAAPKKTVRADLTKNFGVNLENGYILHVGGNQWYKNRVGVIEIYTAWRKYSKNSIPLILVGESPNEGIKAIKESSDYQKDIHFFTGVKDEKVRQFYAGGSAMLFPSLEEGFGWPIAEAMASGCPLITTDKAPMTEVAGDAGFLIKRRPTLEKIVEEWAEESAVVLENVVNMTDSELEKCIERGIDNANRFDADEALGKIEKIYQTILKEGVL